MAFRALWGFGLAVATLSAGMISDSLALPNTTASLTANPSLSLHTDANAFLDAHCKDTQVSRHDVASGTVAPEAPSPAPSMAHACIEATSNARGHYSSTVAPCTFAFHRAGARKETEMDVDVVAPPSSASNINQDDAEYKENPYIEYQTSDWCTSDNGFLTMREYVWNWPDECIGDFARCYSLEHHPHVLLEFLCERRLALEGGGLVQQVLPPGTTHISVDCTEDKDLWLLSYGGPTVDEGGGENEVHYDSDEEEEGAKAIPLPPTHIPKVEEYETKLFNAFLIVGCCMIGIVAVSHWIVKPLVASPVVLRRGSSLGCTCGGSSSNFSEGEDGSGGDCPMHAAEEIHLVGDGDILPLSQAPEEEHDDPLVETTAEMEEEDFHMQIPADFDAIPIVPVTCLPPTIVGTVID